MKQQKKQLDFIKLSLFCKELGMFFKGGVPLYDSFLIMEENAAASWEKELYHEIALSLEDGNSLTEALNDCGQFPSYMLRMIRIGEASGKLEEVLDALFLYYQRQEQMRHSIKSAIFYPCVMAFSTLLILTILMLSVLPVFSQVFEQVGARLPAILQMIADSRDTIATICVILLILLAVLLLFWLMARRTEKGCTFLSGIWEGFPLTRKIAGESESTKFTYSMSLLLSSGLNPDEAADLILSLTESKKTKQKLQLLKSSMEQGRSFSAALSASGLLTPEYARMIAVGTKTGNTDEMMELAAQRCSEDMERRTDRLLASIEPIIVIIMCVIIGAVLLSVMLPLIQIMTTM